MAAASMKLSSTTNALPRSFRRFLADVKAAAMIEFALVFPVFLLFLVGILETGLWLSSNAMLEIAAREVANNAMIAVINRDTSDYGSYEEWFDAEMKATVESECSALTNDEFGMKDAMVGYARHSEWYTNYVRVACPLMKWTPLITMGNCFTIDNRLLGNFGQGSCSIDPPTIYIEAYSDLENLPSKDEINSYSGSNFDFGSKTQNRYLVIKINTQWWGLTRYVLEKPITMESVVIVRREMG